MSTPWSSAQIDEQMQQLHDDIEEKHHELHQLGQEAAALKWSRRRAEASARRAVGGKNKEERDAKVWLWQVEPGVTVADIGQAADEAEQAFEACKLALKAMGEQARLVQSLHVSARESEPGGQR